MLDQQKYLDFLRSKASISESTGFKPESKPHNSLRPDQIDMAKWAVNKGQAAVFASFGLGKSCVQLQILKWVHEHTQLPVLIVCPLGVKQEFVESDGKRLGLDIRYCRNDAEIRLAVIETPYIITNYERVRDGNIDVSQFGGITLDEASILRHIGTKTFQTFSEKCASIRYKFVATATPAPNEYRELINYADFLGVMDRGQSLTRFFQRDSKQAGNLTLYPHMEREFWLWVASWGLFVSKPSDLNPEYSDAGFDLPEMRIHWHRLDVDYSKSWSQADSWGQYRLLPEQAGGIANDSKARQESLADRIHKAKEIVESEPGRHCVIWHDLESERHLISKTIPGVKAVYGSLDLEVREDLILGFGRGEFPLLATKPSISGSGCNFQRHCSKAIFCGPDYKFNDFIQAIHRIYRFLQTEIVDIHIIYTESQDNIVAALKRKWAQHNVLVEKMCNVVKQYGLTSEALQMALTRQLGVERSEVTGDNFRAIHNDCVVETANLKSDSVDEIITSIPFSDHYEYSANYNDFGFNDGDDPFFEQMDFLVPELYRVLKPGRIAAIHTKDRVVYGKQSGVMMYHMSEFSDKTVQAFKKHGFVYMGRITIDTDVVRENSGTYRLGWSENAVDSTKMGCGSNEYVLLFRKWKPEFGNEGTANGPFPVVKNNEEYTRSKWQLQASGSWKSSGDRFLDPTFLDSLDNAAALRLWKQRCETGLYSYEEHVAWCERLESHGNLPSSFMLFSPHSNHPDLWTDIVRMRTLNTEQGRKRQEKHLCPLQFDVVQRLIERYSNEGETILDPFGGEMTVPYMAVKMGRKGIGIELNRNYWEFGVGHCEAVDSAKTPMTLFDWFDMQEAS